jgi:DNA-binding transcriptional LysR family regulator
MRRTDLNDLVAFVAIADSLSFRAAATRLGVTPSALSHSMRQLEERIGARLLNRTTRSVAPTDAGLRLLERLRPAVEQITGALEDLGEERQRPFGRLRISAHPDAAAAVIVPIWQRYLSTYPDVHLELRFDETPIDIVSKGFDAGIGPKDWSAADMIAVRSTGPLRVVVVGAPAYFARHAPPRTPAALARHRCVQFRVGGDETLLKWAFKRNGKSQQISVNGRMTVNSTDFGIRAAVDGLGITYTLESMAEPFLRSGQLVRVLEDWCPAYEGLFLYYPGRRQIPAALRALIDMIGGASAGTSRANRNNANRINLSPGNWIDAG